MARLGSGITSTALLVEPDSGRRPLIRLIDAAQNSIFVEAYILTDLSVVHALERAATQGVDTYVLLEPHPLGMGTQPQKMAAELKAAGVHVRWTRPAFALTHAKLMVLDDRTAIISTANFSRSGFSRNRELLLTVRSRAEVHSLSQLFRADWDRLTYTPSDPDLVISPLNARPDLSALIRNAHTSIRIYAEELADPRLEHALAFLAARGVRVEILLAPGQSPSDVAYLLSHRVAVRSLSSPYMHAKLILVDGRIAFLGSENISAQSLDANREVGVLLHGPLLHRLSALFDRDWSRAAAR